MKLTFLLLIFQFLSHSLNAQRNCIITLKASATTSSFSPPTEKPIQFEITLKSKKVLTSSSNGRLSISRRFMRIHEDEEVVSFDFFNKIDREFYRYPMFTRTTRTLKEYCNQVLVAASQF